MTRRPYTLVAGAALLLVVMLAGCATHGAVVSRPSHFPRLAPQAGITPEQQALIEANCGPFGRPEKDPAFDFGLTRFVVREGYALEHSSVDKVPLWVCERIVPEQLGGSIPRKDAFAADTQLPPGERSELSDYKGSGFSRGHMAPAGNQTKDADRKKATFFLSNMSPQLQPHNSPTWSSLEDAVRSWVSSGKLDVEHVITGGFFYDPAEEDPATADGQIDVQVIGANSVAVPTHFYKIVIGREHDEWRSVGFVVEHRTGIGAIHDFKAFVKSIDWIEERTGLNFFPMLSTPEALRLEKDPGEPF